MQRWRLSEVCAGIGLAVWVGRALCSAGTGGMEAPSKQAPPQTSTSSASSRSDSSFGFDAPLLEVDRFSDKAATHLKRSQHPDLPKPNQPILLDDPPFLVSLLGPSQAGVHCYDLDVTSPRPARFYVFYDQAGNYVLTQFPVVNVAPGDAGYSDVWDIWKVTVPLDFKADNWLRDFGQVGKLLKDPNSGYSAAQTGALLNGPIVPEGSRANHKAEKREGAATLRYAWYRGRRAPFLYFEEHLRWAGDQVPVASMILDSDAPSASLPGVPLGQAGKLRVMELPGDKGYSPLHSLTNASGKSLLDGVLNCPIITP